MKTKIVYVVISSLGDIYWEQAWASAWSARYHNPNAHITLVCDNETLKSSLDCYRTKSLSLFDEIVQISFDASVSNKQRSRQIKTNLRNYISGDFLFVDSDTIITDDLNDIDDFPYNIGMVCDMHSHPCPIPEFYEWVKRTYGIDLPKETKYYNSGVIYAKDNDETKSFFEQWNHNWLLAGDKVWYTDQTPLAKTVMENANSIHDLPDIYNCQICSSVKYLHEAKILHIFNHPWFFPSTIIHPLMKKETYQQIKDAQGIKGDVEALILHCKSAFYNVSSPIGVEEGNFVRMFLIRSFMYSLYLKKRNIFMFLNKLSIVIMSVRHRLKSLFKWRTHK